MALKTIKLTDDIDTSGFASYNGHPNTCMCVPCLSADIDAAAGHLNVPLSRINDGDNGEDIEPTRTRYAAPGTKCGNGVVRKVSPAQVRYMKNLLAERDTSGLTRLPGSEDIENMSLRGARDLITRLLACPLKAVAAAPAIRPATDPMKGFLRKLIAERTSDKSFNVDTIGFDDARKAIDYLKSQPFAPKKVAAVSGPITEDGMYLKDGVVYKVQCAVHGSGNLYAKVLDTDTKRFEYAPGAMRNLTSADKMTLDQAKEWGKLYGTCCKCARTLTDEESIAAGIGPICARRF